MPPYLSYKILSQSTQYISSCKQSRGGINKNVLQSTYSQVVSYLIAILFYLCLTIVEIFFLWSQEFNFCRGRAALT